MQLNKNIIIGIAVVIGLILFFVYIGGGSEETSSGLQVEEQAIDVPQELQSLVRRISGINKVSLNVQDVNQHPVFMGGLVDLSLPLNPESVGRSNPFAPLSTDIQASLSQTAQNFEKMNVLPTLIQEAPKPNKVLTD